MLPNLIPPPHPCAEIFEILSGAQFEKLKQSIAKLGQIDPITTYQGKILDGRSALRASVELGTTPKFVEYHGNDPFGFVLAKNQHRRHLSKNLRALAAARASTTTHGGARVKARNHGLTHEQAAELFGVRARMVDDAARFLKRVHRGRIATELFDAVRNEAITVSGAMKLARLPLEKQRAALAPKQRSSKRKPVNSHREFEQRVQEIAREGLRLCGDFADLEATARRAGALTVDRNERLAELCRTLEIHFAKEASCLEGLTKRVHMMLVEDA